MLRREPTRIELKPEDKDEFIRLREAAQAATPRDKKIEANQQVIASSLRQCASQLPKACHVSRRPCFCTFRPAKPHLHAAVAQSSSRADEVEIKLRLQNAESHDQVAAALEPHLQATHRQENIFFDGAGQELSSQRTVVRIRFYNIDQKALLTIKGQQVLKEGIGRGSEVEEEIDPATARTFVQDPQGLLSFQSDILQPILKKHNVSKLVCLGGFKNERKDFSWQGFKLELDKTMFEHGTVYEVEVETEEPEELKVKLEAFLQEKGVKYKYSTTTKFANFIHKTLE